MRIDLNRSSASELSSELSSQQVSAQGAATAALSAPAVRQGTVDSLKQSVSSGTYELNPSKIAASMVDDYA